MPHIVQPRFQAALKEFHTDEGWMKVIIEGGGLHTHHFDMADPNWPTKRDKLQAWFLERDKRQLGEVVPELTKEEYRLILAGKLAD